jgi:PAS domain-containing protein
LSRPNLSIIPSTDAAFREHVERLAARHPFSSAAELAARLQRLFPRVVVRPSEVSGQADTWYVYRDGIWRSSEGRWWEDERTPHVVVSKVGWIEEANPPARAILGLTGSDELPRFFSDFVAPGTLEDATDLFGVVAAGHELAATTLVRPTSGEVIACDLRVWSDGDRLIGAFRLADDIPIAGTVGGPLVVDLTCRPSSDVVFGRYAAQAMERMPEPTPAGLELRLRRLYPHARVTVDGSAWAVFRDAAGVEEAADQWWRDPGLAVVRYDDQGRILEANPAAEQVFGRALVGRHWQELVTPGTTDQVATVLRLIEEVGWAVSRFRMPAPDGYLFEFDSYTEVAGATFVTIIRPRSGAEVGPPGP